MTDAPATPDPGALIDESMRKAGVVWLSYGADTRPRSAWHVWHDGADYIVSGGIEQPLPGIEDADVVRVTVPSKDTRARLLTWVARRTTLDPASDDWAAIANTLSAARLNTIDRPTQLDRWRAECTISRLEPTGEVLDTPDSPSSESHRAAPADTPATTLGRQPLMYGGLPRRR